MEGETLPRATLKNFIKKTTIFPLRSDAFEELLKLTKSKDKSMQHLLFESATKLTSSVNRTTKRPLLLHILKLPSWFSTYYIGVRPITKYWIPKITRSRHLQIKSKKERGIPPHLRRFEETFRIVENKSIEITSL